MLTKRQAYVIVVLFYLYGHFEWLSEMEREIAASLLAAPRATATGVTDNSVGALKPGIEMHGNITVICLQIEMEPEIHNSTIDQERGGEGG